MCLKRKLITACVTHTHTHTQTYRKVVHFQFERVRT